MLGYGGLSFNSFLYFLFLFILLYLKDYFKMLAFLFKLAIDNISNRPASYNCANVMSLGTYQVLINISCAHDSICFAIHKRLTSLVLFWATSLSEMLKLSSESRHLSLKTISFMLMSAVAYVHYADIGLLLALARLQREWYERLSVLRILPCLMYF